MTDINQYSMWQQKDVEELFAASVFINPVDAIQTCGWLSPAMLINTQIRELWAETLSQVRTDDTHEDAVNKLTKVALEKGLLRLLSQNIADIGYYSLNVLVHANEIARRAYLVNISSSLGDLVKALQLQDDSKVQEVIGRMAGAKPTGSIKLPTAYDIAEKFEQVIRADSRSIPTYLPKIDDAMGGIERQTLTVLAGRPSTGKTALSWQMARSAAYAGQTVLYFQMEMSSINLWGRAACPLANVTWRDVRAKRLTEAQIETLLSEQYKLAANLGDKLYLVENTQTTETIWKAVAEYRPDLVVVDHLRLLKDKPYPGETENKRLGRASQALKELAKATNCGMLVLAQLNRNAAPNNSDLGIPEVKRPSLQDLRDSGEIEENADLVLMLNFADGFQPKAQSNPVEAWVRKFRDGPRDLLIRLLFDTKAEWFTCKEA